MSDTDNQNIENKLDAIWEDNEAKLKKTEELGSFIDVETQTIRDAGLEKGSLSSPGNFNSWKNDSSTGRYFMEGYGAGITRLFKK